MELWKAGNEERAANEVRRGLFLMGARTAVQFGADAERVSEQPQAMQVAKSLASYLHHVLAGAFDSATHLKYVFYGCRAPTIRKF
jgi:hypothetical protein